MKKRSKVILVSSLVLACLVALGLHARNSDGCPIDLPPGYDLITYYPGERSGDMAYRMSRRIGMSSTAYRPSSAKFWIFEAPGSVQDAANSLQEHLRTSGVWQREELPNGNIAFATQSWQRLVISRTPTLDKSAPPRHRVHISGERHIAGWYETMLSKLPGGILKMFRSKHPVRPISYTHP